MTKPAPFTNSYMELCFHVDGGTNLYLRVPTVWDCITNVWRGFIKTPVTQKLISASGKNSFELQNSFNKELHAIFEKGGTVADEVMTMFQPLSYWDEMQNT